MEWSEPTPNEGMKQRRVQVYDGSTLKSQVQYVRNGKWSGSDTRGVFEEARGWISVPTIMAYNPLSIMGRNKLEVSVTSARSIDDDKFGPATMVTAESQGNNISAKFAQKYGNMCVSWKLSGSHGSQEFEVVEVLRGPNGSFYPSKSSEKITAGEELLIDWTIKPITGIKYDDRLFDIVWEERSTVSDSDTNNIYLVQNGKLVPHPVFGRSYLANIEWTHLLFFVCSFGIVVWVCHFAAKALKAKVQS